MQETKVKGIVVFSKDYKDNDKLITIFTLEKGIIYGVLKGVKKENAKFKFAKEPFCFADFILQGSGDFNVVSCVSLIENFYDLTSDMDKFFVGSTILKIIPMILKDNQNDSALFIETIKALKELTYGNSKPYYVIILFLIKIFESMGYKLSLDKCNSCGNAFISKRYLNIDGGDIVCPACRSFNSIEISNLAHSVFKIIGGLDYEKLGSIKLNESGTLESLKILEIIFENRFMKKVKLIL